VSTTQPRSPTTQSQSTSRAFGSTSSSCATTRASFDITCSGDAGATPLVGCPCQSGPRDVFYFQSPTGTQTFVTNLDSTWAVNFAEPNDLRVDLEVGDGRLDLEVVTSMAPH
jgi:hypothetical protein